MEEAKTGEAGDGGKLIPAFEVVSPRPGSTQENQVVLTSVNTPFNSEGSARKTYDSPTKMHGDSDFGFQPCCIHWLNVA
jgi:hypothetical protein